MTQLISKASRDALGIDTIARGIVYATLMLKAAEWSKVELRTKESYSSNVLKGDFSAVITLDYERVTFFTSAINHLEGIIPLGNGSPSEIFTPVTPAIAGIPIPDDIPEVTNLEEYLVWLLLEFYEAGLAEPIPKVGRITISQGETADRFYRKFSYSVSYSPTSFAATRNILQAVDGDAGGAISTLFDNTTTIDNAFLLTN